MCCVVIKIIQWLEMDMPNCVTVKEQRVLWLPNGYYLQRDRLKFQATCVWQPRVNLFALGSMFTRGSIKWHQKVGMLVEGYCFNDVDKNVK